MPNFFTKTIDKTIESLSDAHSRLTGPQILRIGSGAPPFKAKCTTYYLDPHGLPENDIDFHSYIEKRWAVLFSHPCDFTPVCTTEIEAFALKQPEFEKRHTRLIGLSVGNVSVHKVWVSDINSKLLQDKGTRINFPIVADDETGAAIAKKYNMLDQVESPINEHVQKITKCNGKLHTIRSVFIISPEKEIRVILSYPMETGRNVDEIIRIIDSLQAREDHGEHIVTKEGWKPGDDVLIKQEDAEAIKSRRPDIKDGKLPYLKWMPLPMNLLRGYRQGSFQPRVQQVELGTPTPTESNSNPNLGGPSNSETSSAQP